MIQSPIGAIHLRAPTEDEAVRFEDRYAAARRKPDDGSSDGSVYDNGLDEVLACVTSHKVAELHPSDGGLLDDAPAFFEVLASEFRRLGGANLGIDVYPDAVTEEYQRGFGKKAVGLSYGGVNLVARKITWPEYVAMSQERDGGNMMALFTKYGKRCIVSHGPEELKALCEKFPYLSMTVGARLYNVAQGAVDSKMGKSESASPSKTPTSTSQPQASLQPDTASAGGES